MSRDNKHIELSRSISESLTFISEATTRKSALLNNVTEYDSRLRKHKEILNLFPSLNNEIASGLTLLNFNHETAKQKVDDLDKALEKLDYISSVLHELDEVTDSSYETKLGLSSYKAKFKASAQNMGFRSIDVLMFEMQQFVEKFKQATASISNESQKRQKVKALMMQEHALINEFAMIKNECERVVAGTSTGNINADYILANYGAIRSNMSKINEFSIYFSRLSRDYINIFAPLELDIFRTAKPSITLLSLQSEFMKLNAKSIEVKNRIAKLDNLRAIFTQVKKDFAAKQNDISSQHQLYIRGEINAIETLLITQVNREYESAEKKINIVRDLLKKEVQSAEEKFSQSFVISQNIARYRGDMFIEDADYLQAELDAFSNGASRWNKADFDHAIQGFIRGKNEVVKQIRQEYDLYLTKNRDYKNKLENIANIQSSKQEVEALIKDMSSFKIFKTSFYKFIK